MTRLGLLSNLDRKQIENFKITDVYACQDNPYEARELRIHATKDRVEYEYLSFGHGLVIKNDRLVSEDFGEVAQAYSRFDHIIGPHAIKYYTFGATLAFHFEQRPACGHIVKRLSVSITNKVFTYSLHTQRKDKSERCVLKTLDLQEAMNVYNLI